MSEMEKGPGYSPESERPESRQLTREEVVERIGRGEDLERARLCDLDLAGLYLEKRKFRGADVRGLKLFREDQAEAANVRETDWTDATVGDFGAETVFAYADAEGATFGFTETLNARRERQARAGGKPKVEDSGAYLNFNGQQAKFGRSRWNNIDFGGACDSYESRFQGADLERAVFAGCDLTNIDLSTSKFDDLTVEDPVSLAGMAIAAEQVEAVARGLRYSDPRVDAELKAALAADGPRRLLEESFGVVVIDKKE